MKPDGEEDRVSATEAIAMTDVSSEALLKEAMEAMGRVAAFSVDRAAIAALKKPTRWERFRDRVKAFAKTLWNQEPIEVRVRRAIDKNRKKMWRFVAYFYYNGLHLSLGFHLCPHNIEIHVPCGFFRIGFQDIHLDVGTLNEETKNYRAFGFEGRWW